MTRDREWKLQLAGAVLIVILLALVCFVVTPVLLHRPVEGAQFFVAVFAGELLLFGWLGRR